MMVLAHRIIGKQHEDSKEAVRYQRYCNCLSTCWAYSKEINNKCYSLVNTTRYSLTKLRSFQFTAQMLNNRCRTIFIEIKSVGPVLGQVATLSLHIIKPNNKRTLRRAGAQACDAWDGAIARLNDTIAVSWALRANQWLSVCRQRIGLDRSSTSVNTGNFQKNVIYCQNVYRIYTGPNIYRK